MKRGASWDTIRSSSATGLKYDFKIKYHHSRIEDGSDGLTVVKGSFEPLYYNIKLCKVGKEKSAKDFSFVMFFVNYRVIFELYSFCAVCAILSQIKCGL